MSETAFTPPICAKLEARVPDFGRMLVYKQERVQRLVNPDGPEASAIIKALVSEGGAVMRLLQEHGPSIVPHLLDNDDNAGERFRAALTKATGQ